jgi:outer membrane protein assembly factor BamB
VNATNKRETPSYESGAGTLYWEVGLPVGEKVWSAPKIAGDNVYIVASTGTMESGDPREDTSSGTGRLYAFKLEDGSQSWDEPLEIGKTRGSIYLDKNHAYMTTVANEIVQVGNGNFIQSSTNNVVLRSWQQLN